LPILRYSILKQQLSHAKHREVNGRTAGNGDLATVPAPKAAIYIQPALAISAGASGGKTASFVFAGPTSSAPTFPPYTPAAVAVSLGVGEPYTSPPEGGRRIIKIIAAEEDEGSDGSAGASSAPETRLTLAGAKGKVPRPLGPAGGSRFSASANSSLLGDDRSTDVETLFNYLSHLKFLQYPEQGDWLETVQQVAIRAH